MARQQGIWDWICLGLFALSVAAVLFFALHRHSFSVEGIDRASHDLVVQHLQQQLEDQQDQFAIIRNCLLGAVAALFGTCGLLYRNARTDSRANRALIDRIMSALDGCPAKKKEASAHVDDPADSRVRTE